MTGSGFAPEIVGAVLIAAGLMLLFKNISSRGTVSLLGSKIDGPVGLCVTLAGALIAIAPLLIPGNHQNDPGSAGNSSGPTINAPIFDVSPSPAPVAAEPAPKPHPKESTSVICADNSTKGTKSPVICNSSNVRID